MIRDPSHDVVRRYFEAMRRGPGGTGDIVDLFAEHATYIEPFSGQARTHVGREAIRANLSTAERPPDLTIEVHTIETEGEEVVATWTCFSPAFPGPVPGVDRYRIEAGLIVRLETRITDR